MNQQRLMLLLMLAGGELDEGIKFKYLEDFFWLKEHAYIVYGEPGKVYVDHPGLHFIAKALAGGKA